MFQILRALFPRSAAEYYFKQLLHGFLRIHSNSIFYPALNFYLIWPCRRLQQTQSNTWHTVRAVQWCLPQHAMSHSRHRLDESTSPHEKHRFSNWQDHRAYRDSVSRSPLQLVSVPPSTEICIGRELDGCDGR